MFISNYIDPTINQILDILKTYPTYKDIPNAQMQNINDTYKVFD